MKHKLAPDCINCDLRETCKQVVWGNGPEDPSAAEWMLIAEAPGHNEDFQGVPLVGLTGEETTWLLNRIGLKRAEGYLTNVIKCRPPGNKDPKPEQIAACSPWLEQEIRMVQPELIILMGRFATHWFLPEWNMELCHGIPFQDEVGRILIPTYHVAAGLHQPSTMLAIQSDFKAIKDVLAGVRPPRHIEDPFNGKEQYESVGSVGDLRYLLLDYHMIGVDTEGTPEKPWSVQFSRKPGEAFIIRAHQKNILYAFNDWCSNPEHTTLLHNAPWDIPVLEALGVFPATVADTISMAYLLQGEPLGLKPLSFRHAGMEMKSYKEVVRESTRLKALKYLAEAVEYDWPDPKPVLEWPKGKPKIRHPQNPSKRIYNILRDSTLKDADPYDRWYKIKPEEGRDYTERCIGVMEMGTLDDVDPATATFYACRDADATLRIEGELLPRIVQDGLHDTFLIDMGVIPMAVDMMRNGIKVDIPYLESLSDYFDKRLESIDAQVTRLTEKTININAHDQVADLLFNHLQLTPLKKTKGKTGWSTAEEVLSRMVDEHDVVQLIRDYRELAKLKGTYSDQIPRYAREGDGRVRGNIRLTRTATGRLSWADPNLQNIPIRSEEGRKIRKGFLAEDGCSLVSSDYSQIELRMMAHVSNDQLMIETFNNNEDIHAKTASEMFGIPESRLNKMQHRYPAKRTNFGIPYDITAKGLYRDFVIAGCKGWTVPKCQEFINEWFRLYKGVAKWKKETVLFARRHGYVVDMFGRRRYTPAVRCKTKYLQEKALREAGNHPIQAGAQGVIKTAMGKLWPVIQDWRKEDRIVRPLIQIHDDLVDEIANKDMAVVLPIKKKIMEDAVTLRIPTPVDQQFGNRWEPMYPWKEAA